MNGSYDGWRNWETAQIAYVFTNYRKYYATFDMILDDFGCEGRSRSQAVNRIADEMKDMVCGELYEARQNISTIPDALMLNEGDLDIDYEALAEYIVNRIGYHPEQCSENRKPRTTSGKAPAKKAPARRRRS